MLETTIRSNFLILLNTRGKYILKTHYLCQVNGLNVFMLESERPALASLYPQQKSAINNPYLTYTDELDISCLLLLDETWQTSI